AGELGGDHESAQSADAVAERGGRGARGDDGFRGEWRRAQLDTTEVEGRVVTRRALPVDGGGVDEDEHGRASVVGDDDEPVGARRERHEVDGPVERVAAERYRLIAPSVGRLRRLGHDDERAPVETVEQAAAKRV